MRTVFIISLFFLNVLFSFSQSKEQTNIVIGTFVTDNIEGIPVAARRVLKNKIDYIITSNGIGGNSYASRFVLTPKLDIITKDITATSPAMHVLTIAVTFNIGDIVNGNKFASEYIQVKGVGVNQTKAYLSAIKRIKNDNPSIRNMIKKGKEKILAYYNTNCNSIILTAKTLVETKEFDLALSKLSIIPSACTKCYEDANKAMVEVYNEKINEVCKQKLNEALTLWNSSQNIKGAEKAAKVIAQINPDSKCYKEVEVLYKSIAAKVKLIDKRDWDFKLKEQNLEGERIKAAREIGVAYGKGQPKNVTNNNIQKW
jgi:hypothetical protein